MIRQFRYIAFSLLLAACNKQLDLKPTDDIDAEKAYRNVQDLDLGLLGAYAAVSYSAVRNSALTSDECMLPSDNTTGRNVATYRWQNDPGNTTITEPWKENYIVIDRVNRVLAAIDKVSSKPAEGALKERYRGESLALRAYCHFELLRNFAEKYAAGAMGVPFMASSTIGSPARDAYEVVADSIWKDLAAAKALIPADFDDKSRITRTAVSAIQARFALYNRQWDDAITFATEAINAMPLASRSDFPDIWKDKSSAEVIWKSLRTSSDEEYIGDVFYDYRGYALYVPSFEWMDLFDRERDVRFDAYAAPNPKTGPGRAPYVVNKYMFDADITNLADVKLFRAAEMYLVRAEALAEKNNLTAAANDLNTLRRARIEGYANQSFSNKQALIDAIITERFKELAFEGHRYYDLRRRNLPVTREPRDAVNALGAVLLEPSSYLYVFPVPAQEMRANKNMQQNPGY